MQNMEPEQAAGDGVARLAAAMGQELEEFNRRVPPQQWRHPTIYRVCPRICREDSRVYEPKLVSIGPLHQGKDGLQAMEVHKWRYLQDLLARSPASSLDTCVAGVTAQVQEVRAHYSENLDAITDDELVRMMVLDGSFVIEFLLRNFLRDVDPAFSGVTWTRPNLLNDLLLPENQIPFFVLEILFQAAAPRSLNVSLTELALLSVSGGQFRVLQTPGGTYPPLRFLHWLHVYHSSLLTQSRPGAPHSCWWVTCHKLRRMRKKASKVCSSAASLLSCNSPWGSSGESPVLSAVLIPRASMLKEAGVRFRSRQTTTGVTFMWEPFSVTFANGTLELPYLQLNDLTYCLLWSLITFEQCCPQSGTYFTSLADLMSQLMESEADVALLQDCDVVHHELGSQGEAALFFSKLCKDVPFTVERHFYNGVIKEVNDYCEADRRRWREG